MTRNYSVNHRELKRVPSSWGCNIQNEKKRKKERKGEKEDANKDFEI